MLLPQIPGNPDESRYPSINTFLGVWGTSQQSGGFPDLCLFLSPLHRLGLGLPGAFLGEHLGNETLSTIWVRLGRCSLPRFSLPPPFWVSLCHPLLVCKESSSSSCLERVSMSLFKGP